MAWDRELSYDVSPRVQAAFEARLDESLGPRDPSLLLQVVRELDLPPDSRAVDVGCGVGTYAVRLAMHFGLRVLGIDPVQRHLDAARAARRDLVPDIASRLSFERAAATDVPVPDSSVDLVWCRDVMTHVERPDQAYAEFARVLRPGGHVVAYQPVVTDLLAPEDAERLLEVRGVVPSSADPGVLDAAIADSGLEVVETFDLASEWAEWSQEQDGVAGRALLRLARLLREPDRYRSELGDAAYDAMLGASRWEVHRMTGGLADRVDVLRKPWPRG
ncbi:class I SAM-dependent methyltransferase [Nocardioides xinjiangensis]|uniref:class I SAM-dependent methyltransferase n=1 Tax=Nocardioides xinjiangensis TaxID=2817376 RepID=UPI001B301DB5|nr:class I SAM-dependent methyltransferase [Nocardioides sp. SYSU D00778]